MSKIIKKTDAPIPFVLSNEAIEFIKSYALKELQITNKIDEEALDKIVTLATDYELQMMDDDGNDYFIDYPEKARNEFADHFVSEISGKWSNSEPDYEDLNKRLNLD